MPGADKWIIVAEALIADTQRLQIKRLRLRRRVRRPAANMMTPQQAYSRFLQPDGLPTPAASVDGDEEEEEFREEVLCDVDDTLATAIEQVIAGADLARCGCRTTMLGALEKVVGGVMSGAGGERNWNNVLTEGVGKWIGEVDEAR